MEKTRITEPVSAAETQQSEHESAAECQRTQSGGSGGAGAGDDGLTPNQKQILFLQRTQGNAATQHIMRAPMPRQNLNKPYANATPGTVQRNLRPLTVEQIRQRLLRWEQQSSPEMDVEQARSIGSAILSILLEPHSVSNLTTEDRNRLGAVAVNCAAAIRIDNRQQQAEYDRLMHPGSQPNPVTGASEDHGDGVRIADPAQQARTLARIRGLGPFGSLFLGIYALSRAVYVSATGAGAPNIDWDRQLAGAEALDGLGGVATGLAQMRATGRSGTPSTSSMPSTRESNWGAPMNPPPEHIATNVHPNTSPALPAGYTIGTTRIPPPYSAASVSPPARDTIPDNPALTPTLPGGNAGSTAGTPNRSANHPIQDDGFTTMPSPPPTNASARPPGQPSGGGSSGGNIRPLTQGQANALENHVITSQALTTFGQRLIDLPTRQRGTQIDTNLQQQIQRAQEQLRQLETQIGDAILVEQIRRQGVPQITYDREIYSAEFRHFAQTNANPPAYGYMRPDGSIILYRGH